MQAYLDADIAYLLGLLVARGQLLEIGGVYTTMIAFPKASLSAEGLKTRFEGDRELRVELAGIRERVAEVVGGDARTVDGGDIWQLTVSLTKQTAAWRNLLRILENRTSFEHFSVPTPLLQADTPTAWKREFVRGFADVAGNIRPANRDWVGRHRVRLDVLNYRTNWAVPVQLCQLLQDHLRVAVYAITWGHPNMGRDWREHQVNIYAEEFSRIGFSLSFKQKALDELAEANRQRQDAGPGGCPGERLQPQREKPEHGEEWNVDRLPVELFGQHFDRYWQICRALGCPRRPGCTAVGAEADG